MREGLSARGLQHTEQCRTRIERCLANDGDPRMQPQVADAVAGQEENNGEGAMEAPVVDVPEAPVRPHDGEPREEADDDDNYEDGYQSVESFKDSEDEESEDTNMHHVRDDDDDEDKAALKKRGMPDGVAR